MAQIFPRWTNQAPTLILVGTLVLGGGGTFGMYWWASPYNTDVGYKPVQPIEYSHKLHAGELGVDCRYCHSYAERSAFAGVPPTATCMNCHTQVKKDSQKLKKLRESWADGKGDKPIEWVRIHKLPDFAFFNHSAHLGVGVGENRAAVGCETCHGRIDTMDVVKQVQPLSMSWCLECHSNPAPNLRPVEQVTAMGWTGDLAWRDKAQHIAGTLNPPGSLSAAQKVLPDGKLATYSTAGCNGCHR
ncbi:MAG: cytochrome c3 family protein [Myxococcales bacterium]|nr:cytochrome c3 family protein [Myxococcales bacterium]